MISMGMQWRFKQMHTLEERKHESFEMINKYPDRVPVIIERYPAAADIAQLDRNKFLVPYDCTVAQFQWTIRRRCHLNASKAIFLFVGRTLPQACALMGELYQKHRDEDGFLYMAYSGENTFGFSSLK